MTKSSWRETAELVGIAAIVASLIFVGLELRQTHRAAENDINFSIFSSFLEMRSVENEYADIWVRGNGGEALDPAEMSIYTNLVRNRHSQSAWSFNFFKTLDSDMYLVPIADLAGFLHLYPNARYVWETLREDEDGNRRILLPDHMAENLVEFNELVRANLSQLEQTSK